MVVVYLSLCRLRPDGWVIVTVRGPQFRAVVFVNAVHIVFLWCFCYWFVRVRVWFCYVCEPTFGPISVAMLEIYAIKGRIYPRLTYAQEAMLFKYTSGKCF